MNNIGDNLASLHECMHRACQRSGRDIAEITLVAVTKETDSAAVETAFRLGQSDFGENRVQEACLKIGQLQHLKPGVNWHMIGHLQSNKARQAMGLFDMIQSVDSVKLARLMNRQAVNNMPVLLQVDFTGGATRSGFSVEELRPAFEEISRLPKLSVRGLMTIAPLVDDPQKARPFFRRLRQLGEELRLEHLSMGMTDDFEVAIEEGATIIRIGRAIFGQRRI
ncbi:MAG TPA: YggS family pyridoxal phosphate-dependent enzyme [Dehalococcoidia bacterium]|nr:YggS family pyridoxal phosphate-dependent enzyme [Dehalococcoidia bacterium]